MWNTIYYELQSPFKPSVQGLECIVVTSQGTSVQKLHGRLDRRILTSSAHSFNHDLTLSEVTLLHSDSMVRTKSSNSRVIEVLLIEAE